MAAGSGAFCQTGGTAPAASTPKAVPENELVIPEAGQAAPAAAGGTATTGGAVNVWDFVRMILVLAAVVGFIYLIFFVLKKGAGRKIQENDLISVLGSRTLSANRALHLVEVGKAVYLIGSSENSVGLIAEVTDKESLDTLRLKAAESSAPAAKKSFQQVLSDIFKPANKKFSVDESIELLKSQRERLKKM
jgi:flagellar protein FliO/FliZ